MVDWVHHDGVGYVFPEPTSIHLSSQKEQGRWSDITDEKNIAADLVFTDVFKLWYDHGYLPDNASYSYIVVPDVTAEKLSPNRHVEILSNTKDVQAVKHTKIGISQIVFFTAGEIQIDDAMTITLDQPGLLMVKMDEANLIREMSVADPSRKLQSIGVTVAGLYDVMNETITSTTDETSKQTRILADLPQGEYAGESALLALTPKSQRGTV